MIGKEVLYELEGGFNNIKNNTATLKRYESQGDGLIGAGKWLVDNIYLIEKEYKGIKHNLPKDYFYNLPYLENSSGTDIQRIYFYAKEYIKK